MRVDGRHMSMRIQHSSIILVLLLSSLVLIPALELSQHTLSRCVLRYGDPALFRPLHRKLRNKECIHVAIIGGSVAAGHKLPNSTFQAFPVLFEAALNEAYPCNGRHNFTTFAQGGMATDYWIDFLVGSQEVLLAGVDLVVVDTAVNDMRSLLQRAGRFMDDVDAFIRVQTEILMTLLLQRPRRAPAADPQQQQQQPPPGASCARRTNYSRVWTGAAPVWLGTSTHNTDIWRGPLPRGTDAVYAHLPAAIAHGVPYVSIIDGLGPFRTRAAYRFLKRVWWSGDFHPGVWGHEALAQVLLHFLSEQLLFLDDLPWSEDSRVVPYCPRPPSYVKQDDLDMYLDASPLHIATVQPITVERMRGGCRHWSVMEDVPHKPGLLSEVPGSQCTIVAFAEQVARKPVRVGQLHVTLLKSYERMGRVRVTVASVPALRPRRQDDAQGSAGGGAAGEGGGGGGGGGDSDPGDCVLQSDDVEVLGRGEIDCLWQEHISEARVEVVKVGLPATVEGDRCMAFTFEVLDTAGRSENKVKIMGLTLF